MHPDHADFHAHLQACDDIPVNPLAHTAFRFTSRRDVLRGGIGLSLLGLLGGSLAACERKNETWGRPCWASPVFPCRPTLASTG